MIKNRTTLCPKCGKKMFLKKKDISHSFKKNINYERMILWCKKDDIWLNWETPKLK